MITGYNDIVKVYGQYRMKMNPHIETDRNGKILHDKSYGHITVYDISLKYDLLWGKTFPIKEAHAAMTLFETIGYYPMPQ